MGDLPRARVPLMQTDMQRPSVEAPTSDFDASAQPVCLGNRRNRILLFDSGLGGLSVLTEVVRVQPAADIIYVADDAGFPYGNWSEPALVEHVVELMGDLIERFAPDLVVIACNTASTLVLAPLRERYALPFVGTVPAIKPAAELTRTGLVTVLATPGTVARDYTRQLIDQFAHEIDVTLVGSNHLAGMAETWLRDGDLDEKRLADELAPCFRETERGRTDTIVLGCTHYPLLLEAIRRVAPWDVQWVDPAPAIARRVQTLLPSIDGLTTARSGRIVFTSGEEPAPALLARLPAFGLAI